MSINIGDDLWSPSDTAAIMKRIIIKCRFTHQDVCVICLENMYNSICDYLPCKHVFHHKCLKRLIDTRTYTCPLCRYDFIETLALFGINTQPVRFEETNDELLRMTIFSQIDLYDFIMELLWLRYDNI
jgi:hypothetical protein